MELLKPDRYEVMREDHASIGAADWQLCSAQHVRPFQAEGHAGALLPALRRLA